MFVNHNHLVRNVVFVNHNHLVKNAVFVNHNHLARDVVFVNHNHLVRDVVCLLITIIWFGMLCLLITIIWLGMLVGNKFSYSTSKILNSSFPEFYIASRRFFLPLSAINIFCFFSRYGGLPVPTRLQGGANLWRICRASTTQCSLCHI